MTRTRIKGDIVFNALTRPQMFGGVTYGYFVVNAILTTEAFLLAKTFWVALLPLAVHAFGYLLCLEEPRFFDLWFVKMTRTPRVANWKIWLCNSYKP